MRKSNGRSMYHHELGRLYDGDKLKLKIMSYKPTTIFEAVLLISSNGRHYLQQNKIDGGVDDYPPEGSGNYGYLWEFNPDSRGNDYDDEVFISRIIERAEQQDPPVTSPPVPKTHADLVTESYAGFKSYYGESNAIQKQPEPEQDSRYQTPRHQDAIIIRRRRK